MQGIVEFISILQRQHGILEYFPRMGIGLEALSRGVVWWVSI